MNDIQTEIRGNLGIITLNRPGALNSLSLEMIRQISAILTKWATTEAIRAVLFLGAGDRAFCAGGDVKSFYRMGMAYRRGEASREAAALFFAEEYGLDHQIFHYSKPTIAFMDGIVMGGGFGIGGNCKYRIATEKTAFAMPETGIGFFPDVGSVFHLLKAPHHFGKYLALSAVTINGAEMLTARLADYFLPSEARNALIEDLARGGNIEKFLSSRHAAPAEKTSLQKNADDIEEVFRHDTLQEILKALADVGSIWALEALSVILSRSPASLRVTAEHLRRSRGVHFDDVIATDFILTQRFLERVDIYEGIRAAVIDKDRNPQWSVKTAGEIDQGEIDAYFKPTGIDIFNKMPKTKGSAQN